MSNETQIVQAIKELMDGEKGNAMAKGLRNLTILLGKLGVAKDQFIVDHDAQLKTYAHTGFPRGRPPWRTGIDYGISLYKATALIKKYIKARATKKFLKEHPLE